MNTGIMKSAITTTKMKVARIWQEAKLKG